MGQSDYWLRKAQTGRVTRRRFVGGITAAGADAAVTGREFLLEARVEGLADGRRCVGGPTAKEAREQDRG